MSVFSLHLPRRDPLCGALDRGPRTYAARAHRSKPVGMLLATPLPSRDSQMSTVVAMKLRREEEHVRAVLSQHLGVPVEPHDDGSIQSMWDLTIRYPDRSAAPVEVTSDVSGEMLRT